MENINQKKLLIIVFILGLYLFLGTPKQTGLATIHACGVTSEIINGQGSGTSCAIAKGNCETNLGTNAMNFNCPEQCPGKVAYCGEPSYAECTKKKIYVGKKLTWIYSTTCKAKCQRGCLNN